MIYTVIGIWDHEGSDDTTLIVAGVVEGEAFLVDRQADVGEYGVYTRYATTVQADSPEQAEALAIEEAEAPYRDAGAAFATHLEETL